MTDGIWVYTEQRDGVVSGVTLELLGEARRLARSIARSRGNPVETCAVVLGHKLQDCRSTLVHHGADKVILVDSEELAEYSTEVYTGALTELVREYRPFLIFFGATYRGKGLAARISARLKCGLVSGCTYFRLDEKGALVMTRSAYQRQVSLHIACRDVDEQGNPLPQIATIPPKTVNPLEPELSRRAEIIDASLSIDGSAIATRIIDVVRDRPGKMDLEDADVIVAGGGGVKDAANFKILEDLAEVLGGTVGASRAVVDKGWRPREQQIGTTGKTVTPSLYIACGISGSIYHTMGMKFSDTIVAVNTDRQAPIFNVADVGIVGDLFEVVPAMTETFRQQREALKKSN